MMISQLSGMEWRELDSATYLAALYGGMDDDGFYSANSERMRSTVAAFVDAMTVIIGEKAMPLPADQALG